MDAAEPGLFGHRRQDVALGQGIRLGEGGRLVAHPDRGAGGAGHPAHSASAGRLLFFWHLGLDPRSACTAPGRS